MIFLPYVESKEKGNAMATFVYVGAREKIQQCLCLKYHVHIEPGFPLLLIKIMQARENDKTVAFHVSTDMWTKLLLLLKKWK